MTTLATLGHGIRLARAASAQVPDFVALLADDPRGGGRERSADDPAYGLAFEGIDADPHQLLVVAVNSAEAVVATLQLTLLPGLSRGGLLRAQIEAVRVARGQRGSGLGTTMLQWVIGYAREQGAGLVQLTSDKTRADAVRFYEQLGFVASHEGLKLTI